MTDILAEPPPPTYFFTTFIRNAIVANQAVLDSQKIKLIFFRYAPAMTGINPAWAAARTKAELIASSPGWVEAAGVGGYPISRQVTLGFRTIGGSKYLTYTEFAFGDDPTTTPAIEGLTGTAEVRAIGIEFVGTISGVVNPLVFVTTTPLGGKAANLAPLDALTSNPDTVAVPAIRWLVSWSVGSPDPVEGPLVIAKGPPDFEVSGSQHAWMYPQRANMIANPSFEAPGTNFWSSNGALTRVSGGAPSANLIVKGEVANQAALPSSGNTVGDNWLISVVIDGQTVGEIWTWNGTAWVDLGVVPGASAWAGKCTGTNPIMESNLFPALLGEYDSAQWTVQLMAKGTGRLKVGLVYWDGEYRSTAANWGESEEWALSPNVWIHVATHRHTPEAHLMMLRLELLGSDLTIDRVLVERGYLKDWPYFDGDEKYGARDDFSWYGGSTRRGASYSLWYNHRRAVTGRLYARTVDPNDPSANVTDEDMEEQGLVYRWVPAGITVVPHLDVLYPFDAQNPVPPKPAGVLPYFASPATPDGVQNPWV